MSRRVDPIRQEFPILGRRREEAMAHYHATLAALHRLDDQLTALAAERRQLRDELRDQHRRLWTDLNRRGRRPMPDGTESLPPARHDARPLWGRRLRSVCLALLRAQAGPVRLVELHTLLHHHGFVVDSDHPVKALADALGYEALAERVRRVARGTYELVPGPRPPRGRHGNPTGAFAVIP